MALTGIQIYKYLPKTNCKECGFPTCLAFAMKLAAKAVEASLCPYLSEEAKSVLAEAFRPPIPPVIIGSGEKKLEEGNELVMFRHEKRFFNPTGLVVRINDTSSAEDIGKLVEEVDSYGVDYVGKTLGFDGFAIDNKSGDATTFANCVELVKSKSNLPLVLMSEDPNCMAAALEKVAESRPLIYAANKDNCDQVAELAKKFSCPLVASSSDGLSELAELTEKLNKAGVQGIILDPGARDFGHSLSTLTQIRRTAIKKSFQPLGYPIIAFPGEAASSIEEEVLLASQQIAKYANIVVLDHFSAALAYPLLAWRLNIYTDPQVPISLEPGIREIGSPNEKSPLCVTTNFALTYFSIAGELEASARPGAWLTVVDTEGLSVLTAWSAGKFDAERIAKTIKEFDGASKVSHKSLILPGGVAILKGELEEELPDWKVMVGPKEAMKIGGYLKEYFRPE
jgi:acetyl-CoA decarbonylase/synthase complex subunit gamma